MQSGDITSLSQPCLQPRSIWDPASVRRDLGRSTSWAAPSPCTAHSFVTSVLEAAATAVMLLEYWDVQRSFQPSDRGPLTALPRQFLSKDLLAEDPGTPCAETGTGSP